MFTISAIDGFTFPGMMLEPGWTGGGTISASPVRGPEASNRRSLAILPRSMAQLRNAPEKAAGSPMDCMSWMRSFPSRNSMPVMARSCFTIRAGYAGSAFRPVPTAVPPIPRSRSASPAWATRSALRSIVWPYATNSWPSRIGVASCKCVRPDLRILSCLAFRQERPRQAAHGVEQRGQLGQRGQTDRGRDHVVRGLGHVDVVVRMHRLVRATLAAKQLVRAVGEDLVTVHVVRGARPRLVGIHHELVAVFAGQHLVSRPHDRVGELGVETSGLLVREGGGLLDPNDGVHERRERQELGDGEVLAGPLGLDPVERVGRNGQLAQGITLDAGAAHGLRPFGHGAVGLEPGIAHGYPGSAAALARARSLLGRQDDQAGLLPLGPALDRPELLRAGAGATGAHARRSRQILFGCGGKGEVRRGAPDDRSAHRRPDPGTGRRAAWSRAGAGAHRRARRDRPGALITSWAPPSSCR